VRALGRIAADWGTSYLRAWALRGDQVFRHVTSDHGVERAWLSRLLIGVELAATKPHWLGPRVAIDGLQDLAQTYATMLQRLSVRLTPLDANEMTLAGLRSASWDISI
jgi:2-dehydro-3-deoxygalactonokinase